MILFLTLANYLQKNCHVEYHWIYRFVVQDESIRLMDESCGYIEQVDDRTVCGFVSGKGLRADYTTARRQDKGRNPHGVRRHNSFRGFRRRQPSQKDEHGYDYDSSVLPKNCSKKRSLLDEQDDGEGQGATSFDTKTSASYNHHDEKFTKKIQNMGVIT